MSLLIRKPGENDWHEPEISAYENESRLQELIAKSPTLLPVDFQEPVVASTEVQIPDTGPVDVLAVDAAGSITLVECKLQANPEIRRHVVGQLFAYAAGLWKLPYDQLDNAFSAGAGVGLAPLMASSATAASIEWAEEEFRRRVEQNLQAGHFRLVFAVDEITNELKRIVEFLNEHSSPETQILALELGFVADEGVEILVPNVYGEEAARKKARPGRAWDESSFFEALATRSSPEGVRAVRRFYDLAASRGRSFAWGSGPNPSVTGWFVVDGEPVPIWTAVAWTDRPAAVDLLFNHMKDKVAQTKLAKFADSLRQEPSLRAPLAGLEEADYMRKPALTIDGVLTEPGVTEVVESAVLELID